MTNSLCALFQYDNHTIAGDWNAIHPSWSSGNVNQSGRAIYNLLPFNGYAVYHTDTHTHEHHNGAVSTIDLIVSNAGHIPQEVHTNDDLMSDHTCVTFSIDLTLDAAIPKKCFVYQAADWAMYENMISTDILIAPNPLDENMNADLTEQCIAYLTSSIKAAHERAVPSVQKKNKDITISRTTKVLIQHKNKLNRKFVREQNPAIKQLIKSQLNRLRKLTNEHAQIDRNNDWCHLIDNCNDSSKRYWRLLKQLRRKRKSMRLRIGNTNICSPSTIANELGKKFHQSHIAFDIQNTPHDDHIKRESERIRTTIDNDDEFEPFTIDDLQSKCFVAKKLLVSMA